MPWSRGTRLRSPIKHTKMEDDWICAKCHTHFKTLTELSAQTQGGTDNRICKYCTGELIRPVHKHHRQRCAQCSSPNISVIGARIFCWHCNEYVGGSM